MPPGLSTRRILAAALGGWLLVVGWLTLRSAPEMAEIVKLTPWYCVVCGLGGATDVVLNVLLFLPFGILARLARWPLIRLGLCALILTCTIEVTQGTMLVGRDATLGDVIANSSGAVLGWLATAWCGSLLTQPSRARLTALLILACQSAVWIGTGIEFRPALDGPAPWVGRFRRVGNGQDPFEGTVDRVTLDGIPVTTEPMAALPSPRDSLRIGVTLSRSTDRAPPRWASIVRVVDGTPRAFIRLSQVQQGINVEVRLGASGYRFRTPSWRFPAALSIPVGTPWQYEWRWHARAVEMISHPLEDSTRAMHSFRPLSIGLGWSLMHPFVWVIDEDSGRWSLAWIAGWFFLLGWSAGWAGRRFLVLVAGGGLALFVVAGLLVSLPVALLEGGAALAGVGLGGGLATWQRKRPARQLQGGA